MLFGESAWCLVLVACFVITLWFGFVCCVALVGLFVLRLFVDCLVLGVAMYCICLMLLYLD